MKKLVLLLVMAMAMLLSVNVFAGSYVGKKIKKITKDAESQYLSQDDLVTLISGKTIVGVSYKSRQSDNYMKQTFKEDGNILLEVYKDWNNAFVKSIPHRKWSVKEDGTMCIEIKGKACKQEFRVLKIEDKYLSINKKGKVGIEWELKD